MPDYEQISKQAEASLNSRQAKTGDLRSQALDDAGVNSMAAKNFEGADVQQGDELSTNRGYNRRIPPSEGGDLDARGRQTRGQHFEGQAGPHEKTEQFYREHGGENENDISRQGPTRGGFDNTKDAATDGLEASRANVGSNPPGPGGSKYKGEDYYVPESVPDSISAEGNIPPDSVVQSSREAEAP